MRDIRADRYDKTKPYVLFHSAKKQHGHMSNWYMVSFAVCGVTYNCAEQYMMSKKAETFNAPDIVDEIMASKEPQEQKRLGRQVSNFDPAVWDEVAFEFVIEANLAKYRQNEDLKEQLLATGPAIIAEASPTDPIWGIGLGREAPQALDYTTWRGTNKLGQVLMEVRFRLLAERCNAEMHGEA